MRSVSVFMFLAAAAANNRRSFLSISAYPYPVSGLNVTLQSHRAKSSCKVIVQSHCAKSLCKVIVQSHCAKSLCKVIVQSHCAKSLCKVIVQSYCNQLFLGITACGGVVPNTGLLRDDLTNAFRDLLAELLLTNVSELKLAN